MKLICLILTLSACAPKHNVLDIEPELSSYVQAFESASIEHGRPTQVINLVAKMVDDASLEPQQLGVCRISTSSPMILIKRSSWERLGYWGRRELMFHELGHCVLFKLKHSDNPLNMMYYRHLGESVYNEKTFRAFEKQLFTKD